MKGSVVEKTSLLEKVKKFGWAVVEVFPVAGDSVPVKFVYTVGLYQKYKCPELLLSGVSVEIAVRIITSCIEKLDLGFSFMHGQIDCGILEGYPVCFAAIPSEIVSEYMSQTLQVSDAFPPAFQVYWPDRSGFLPWAPGYCLIDKNQWRWGLEPGVTGINASRLDKRVSQ